LSLNGFVPFFPQIRILFSTGGHQIQPGAASVAAAQLTRLVTRLLARGAAGATVVAAGSVIVHQPLLAARLRARLADAHPDLTLRLLDVPPVAGAVALARARHGKIVRRN